MERPWLILTILGLQQVVEYLGASLGIGITSLTYIVELIAQFFCLQMCTLLAQDVLTLVWAHDGQTVGHVHIVMFIEEWIVVGRQNLGDLIKYLF